MSLEGCWLAGNETYRVLQQRRQQEGKKVLAVRQEGKETVGGHHFVSQRKHRRARGERLHQLVHAVLRGYVSVRLRSPPREATPCSEACCSTECCRS